MFFSNLVLALNAFTILNKLVLSGVLFFQPKNKPFFRITALMVFTPFPLLVSNMLEFFGYPPPFVLALSAQVISVSLFVLLLFFLHVLLRIHFQWKQGFLLFCQLVLLSFFLTCLLVYYVFYDTEQRLAYIQGLSKGKPDTLWIAQNSFVVVLTLLFCIPQFHLIRKVKSVKDYYASQRAFQLRHRFAWQVVLAFIISTILAALNYALLPVRWAEYVGLPVVTNFLIFYLIFQLLNSGVFRLRKPALFTYTHFWGPLYPLPSATETGEAHELQEQLRQRIERYFQEEEDYLRPDFRIHDLAQSIGCSNHQINQCLKEQMNTTFAVLVNQERIRVFKQRLLKEEYEHLSIEGLGVQCGFRSKSALYRNFKAKEGLTPMDYKKQKELKG